MLRQIAGSHLPTPIREHKFHETRQWRFDFAWVSELVALEVEGGVWLRKGGHTSGSGFTKDCEKYAEALVLGWCVLRVTSDQVRKGTALNWLSLIMKQRTPTMTTETNTTTNATETNNVNKKRGPLSAEEKAKRLAAKEANLNALAPFMKDAEAFVAQSLGLSQITDALRVMAKNAIVSKARELADAATGKVKKSRATKAQTLEQRKAVFMAALQRAFGYAQKRKIPQDQWVDVAAEAIKAPIVPTRKPKAKDEEAPVVPA